MKSGILFFLVLSFCTAQVFSQEDVPYMTLKKAVRISLQKNDRLRKASQAVREAEYGLGEARSGYFPMLSLQGTTTRLHETPETKIGPFSVGGQTLGPYTMETGEDRYHSVDLILRQPLFQGGKVLFRATAARRSVQLASIRYRRTRQTVIFETWSAFLDILRRKKNLDVEEDILKLTREHLVDVKKRRKVGSVSEYDLLKAETDMLRSEGAYTTAERMYMEAQNQLCRLVELEPPIDFQGTLFHKDREPAYDRELEYALKNRPELRMQDIRIAMAEAQRRAEIAGYMPHVFLTAQGGYQNPEFGQLGGKDEFSGHWQVGLSVNVTLFDGFRTRNRIRKQKMIRAQALSEKMDISKTVSRDIRNALLMLRKSGQMVFIQKKAVKKARKTLALVTEGFNSKVNTQLEVSEARVQVSKAENDFVNALYMHELASIHLDFITGRISERWASMK